MKTDFKNEWLCESCGAKKGSFGAGYTQEMEDDLMAFYRQYTTDGFYLQSQKICSHPSWKRIFEPSIFLNWIEGINNRLGNK